MNKKVDEYIEKQKSPQKEICLELRRIVFKTFPDIEEEMKWGVPTYAVAISSVLPSNPFTKSSILADCSGVNALVIVGRVDSNFIKIALCYYG